MKLSQLESLVKAMRKRADANGIDDPEVKFYDNNRDLLRQVANSNEHFVHMDITEGVESWLDETVVPMTVSNICSRGDYEIPLDVVNKNVYNNLVN